MRKIEKVKLGEIGKIIKRCVVCYAGEIIYAVDIEKAEREIFDLIEKCLYERLQWYEANYILQANEYDGKLKYGADWAIKDLMKKLRGKE